MLVNLFESEDDIDIPPTSFKVDVIFEIKFEFESSREIPYSILLKSELVILTFCVAIINNALFFLSV